MAPHSSTLAWKIPWMEEPVRLQSMGSLRVRHYFPLFQWNNVPDWLSFLVDYNNYFFGAIFNLADAYISVAVVYLCAFHWKFFQD